MRSGGGDPARLKDLIGEVGSRLGLRRPAAVGALWGRWREIVGEDIAAHAEPTSVREGVLRIRTPSPTWASEIGYLADEIKGRVNDALGGDLVREVRVWTSAEPIGRALQPRAEGAREPAPGRAERPSRSSPGEALEAARAAWKRRRSDPREAPREGARGAPRTPEKGR